MQTNIIWTGKFYRSIENCILTTTRAGNEITSTIIGSRDNQIYRVDYHLKTMRNWETTFLSIKTQVDGLCRLLTFEKRDGQFLIDKKPDDQLKHMFEIDISLTPFTNTLAINRLHLKNGEQGIIDVLYFDILEAETRLVKQIYTRLSANHYIYENYDKSFRAHLKIDEQGLVLDYPEFFEMTAKRESNHR